MKKHKTVQVLRIIMPLVAIICLVVFVPWVLVRAWIAPLPDSVQEQADDAIRYGIDGIIVYVDQGGKEPQSYAAGWKNRENKIPADPKALFKIASIGKLYVAVAVVKMVHDSLLSLDDTLADHFPEFAGRIENAEKITLRHMLRHRSGIPNFTDHPDYPWANPPKSSMDALSYAMDLPALFPPDAEYAYSNTNYLLLTELMNNLLGYDHQQFIKAQILLPLGLSHTFSSLEEVDPDDVMSGYAIGWLPDIKMNRHGSMLATAEDVGIFVRSLNDGSLLSRDELAMYASVYEFGHTGLVPGYQSIARYHPDIDAVVVQFVNTSGGNMWTLSEILFNRMVKIVRAKGNAK